MAEYAKRPWYPFYPIDFAEDENVSRMTDAEELAYRRLLDRTWLSKGCTLPDDERILAKMAKCGPRKWASIRNKILSVFPLLPQEPGDFSSPRRHNPRLTAEYNKTCGISKTRAAAVNTRYNSLQHNDPTPTNVLQMKSYPQLLVSGVDNSSGGTQNKAVSHGEPCGMLQSAESSREQTFADGNRNPLQRNGDPTTNVLQTDYNCSEFVGHMSQRSLEIKQKDLDLVGLSTLIARDMPNLASSDPPLTLDDLETPPQEKYLKGAIAFSESCADKKRPWLDWRWRKETKKLSVEIQESVALLFAEFYGFRADAGPEGWAGNHNQLSAIYRDRWREYINEKRAENVAPV